MSNSINILVFILENTEKKLFKEYVFELDKKIIDVKNIILEDLKLNNTATNTNTNEFNYVDLENITDKVYKDFGKLVFNKGILPLTVDNYKLSEFTVGNRTFHFLAIPKINNNNLQNRKISGVLKKVIKEQEKLENLFVYDEDDFPPLGK